MMDGAEQNRSRDDCRCVFARMWVCMCYLISPESTAHPVDPVQWERVERRVVCGSVYVCGRRSGGTYRELQAAITAAAVYKYFHRQSFFQWLQTGSGLSGRTSTLSCITMTLPTNLPVHPPRSCASSVILKRGPIHVSRVSVSIGRFTC